MTRDRMLFVSWVRGHGRSADLADRLGARPCFIAVGRGGRRATAPFRYVVQTAMTVAVLARRRPDVLIVMAPPLPLVVIARAWSRVTGRRWVVDAHTDAVIDRHHHGLRRRFAVSARAADAVVVTNRELARLLEPWDVDAVVLDDPIPSIDAAPPVAGHVLVPSSWHDDEPWPAVFAAAERLPEVRVVVTGRPPAAALSAARPDNVDLVGFVSDADYERLVATAGCVVALTTRPATMLRAAYEALAHLRPLVVSDTDTLRDFFEDVAWYARPTADDIADAVRRALADPDAHEDDRRSLRVRRQADWQDSFDRLRRVVA